ncbi:iron ABC transporter permease [Alteromonas ponticola]|uniref:Iron ABC transporter permease n=1 Tax=Alteromonas aquimaris TaxID=2998417 RepID=A0ABT3P3S9_9ALTE|nr:iron ABC transporter permease [Alteromonas aquimaris]MCW8107205.1 iron ABC transporter permease [Alteromonas aquimaris]
MRALLDPLQGALLILGAILSLPVVVIFASWIAPQTELWQHLLSTVLQDYVINSLLLACGVGIGTLLIGSTIAYIISRYDFPGRTLLHWFALLPLAMPAYIIAYTYTGVLDFSGPIQTTLRDSFGWGYGDYYFPDIRSLWGAIIIMSLVLYPYVYMLARTAFSEQPASLLQVSQMMGISKFKYITQVSLPLARPALFTGTALAMMEALADYGTVQYFGVATFTTGIFRTWFGLGNGLAAAQLSSLLCTFVLIVLLFEKWSRRHIKYYHQGQHHNLQKRKKLTGTRALSAFVLCLVAPLLGFIVPTFQLLYWAGITYTKNVDAQFITLVFNSFCLALAAALIIVILSLLFAYTRRIKNNKLNNSLGQTVSLGYAIPGTVIAVGVLVPLSWADNLVNMLSEHWFNNSVGLIFSGTLFALLFAYSIRFLSVASHNIEAGLSRITPSMDNAARSLGASPARVLKQIHVPLLKTSVLSAALLVFVDVLKELPATLILRPFNFNTLAVRSFELASDERLVDAATPALAIVLVGLIPVVLITHAIDKTIKGKS